MCVEYESNNNVLYMVHWESLTIGIAIVGMGVFDRRDQTGRDGSDSWDGSL